MGSGGGQQISSQLPPPPQPKIQYDPATSGAEAALASAAKQSYASTAESEEDARKRAQLGNVREQSQSQRDATGQSIQPRRRAAASTMTTGIGASSVLTG